MNHTLEEQRQMISTSSCLRINFSPQNLYATCAQIEHNEKFGRYLVASRNIKASEVVLRESCLVCGPNQISGPVCVGCMKGLQANDYLECERCGWPVCQRICQNSPEHRGECELTVARGSKVSYLIAFV